MTVNYSKERCPVVDTFWNRRENNIASAQNKSSHIRIPPLPPSWCNGLGGPGPSHLSWLHDHTQLDTPHTHTVALLWTSDQLDAETSTWHTTFTRDRHPCPQRDSNPQSQQANGHKYMRRINQQLLQGAKVGTFTTEDGVGIRSTHSFHYLS
jgi:hypothetical protein